MKSPLTLRGAATILAGVYLILGPASESADLVAGIIGFSILILTVSALLISMIGASVYRRRLSANVHLPDSEIKATEPQRIVIKLNGASVPSLFVLKVELIFERSGPRSHVHEVLGLSKKERLLIEDVILPHRGSWRILGLSMSFGDRFGCGQLTWTIPLSDTALRVIPSSAPSRSFPILSSSHRSGDDVTNPYERSGDPYDLKPYHPSDGMRKILWKVFAKSGELISRHPEHSMTPEGKVVIFVLARREDDYLCDTAIQYVSQLEELTLEVWAGCTGMDSIKGKPCRNALALRDLLINAVWNSDWVNNDGANSSSVLADLDALLAALPQKERQLDSIIIFVAAEAFTSSTAIKTLKLLGSALESNRIQPIFFMGEHRRKRSGNVVKTKLRERSKARRFLFGQDIENESNIEKYYPDFIKVCAQTNWQVIL